MSLAASQIERHADKLSRRIKTFSLFETPNQTSQLKIYRNHFPPKIVSISTKAIKPWSKLGEVIHNDFSPRAVDFFSYSSSNLSSDMTFEALSIVIVFVVAGRERNRFYSASEHEVARATTWMINWEFLEWFADFVRSRVFLFFVGHLSLPRGIWETGLISKLKRASDWRYRDYVQIFISNRLHHKNNSTASSEMITFDRRDICWTIIQSQPSGESHTRVSLIGIVFTFLNLFTPSEPNSTCNCQFFAFLRRAL